MSKTEKQNARKKKLAGRETSRDENRSGGGEAALYYKVVVVLLGLGVGYLNHQHVSTLFENDRHFSHLSNMEREMTFRTEMGMYYSYYKTIVNAESFSAGVHELYRNNKTEYPDTINTLKRFNLYPELVIGLLYRVANQSGFLSQECWKVERGQGLAPVYSCEGLQDPPHFYLAAVWVCAGLTTFVLFLLATILSGSILGGVLTSCCFFFNHGESTRVMWTPPLRESFAFPICLLQILAVTCSLDSVRTGWKNILSISVTTAAFILCWQFAQFMLFTQVCAVFVLYSVGSISKDTLSSINISLIIGLLHAVALMFGNEMLFCSLLFASLTGSLLVSLLLHNTLTSSLSSSSVLRVLIQVTLFVLFTVGVKTGLSKAMLLQDDAHVMEIFKSKFTDFKSFNTQLYNCAKEFDFLGWEMPLSVSKTLLLPAACLPVLVLTFTILSSVRNNKYEDFPSAGVLYTVLQTGAYLVMAVLIMRLKLFLTPHLCLVVSLLASPRGVLSASLFRGRREYHLAVLMGLLAAMSYQGFQNIQQQRQIMGEYSDPDLEELFDWVNEKTSPTSVFAGSMPLMANLMLSTGRAVVNHPHFEDAGSRSRTKRVYSVYSRKSPQEVFDILKDMQVDFVIISQGWCLSVEREGCAMPELWDLQDPGNSGRPAVCPGLWRNPEPFLGVFRNQMYAVLQLTKKVVQFKEGNSRPR